MLEVKKMPRQARVKSKSGIYHIMLRGINRQQIFEDEEDNLKFLKILAEYKPICKYKIYAYCLMGNHAHLLIKEEFEEIQQIMKRIAGKYVYWYNGKYQRTGHLFQDRFKSEPIEDEKRFFAVLKYIHQNPVKAGISTEIGEYPYNSYNEYVTGEKIVDTDFVNEMIGKEQFVQLHEKFDETKCLEMKETPCRVTDEQAKRMIARLSKCESATEFQRLETEKRNQWIADFKKRGLSIRQISRLTGISKGIVERT